MSRASASSLSTVASASRHQVAREEIELGRPRGVRCVGSFDSGAQLEGLVERIGGTRDVRDRERKIEPDVAVDVRQPAGLARERTAMQQHERGIWEALERAVQVTRVRTPQVEVGVAEAAVHLHGQRITRRLVRLQGGDDLLGHPVKPAAVRSDRLQRGVALLARGRSLRRRTRAARLEPSARERTAAGELPHLVPGCADALWGVAVVDEEQLCVRRAQQRRDAYSAGSDASRCSYTAHSSGSTPNRSASNRIARR